MLDVLVASARELPRPDDDQPLLLMALASLGLRAEARCWDDPTVDWATARMCLIRSTWNYVRHYAVFLAWAEHVASVSQLWNPLAVVRWNSHKSYLTDLAARGLPVVPTRLVRRGERLDLSAVVTVWPRFVIKPAVSAGSYGTLRGDADALARAQDHLDQWLVKCDMLVQPYLASVEGYGERALVWMGGKLSHAVRKTRRFAGDPQHISPAVSIAADEAAAAERLIAAVPQPLLYARIDLARRDDGTPCLMELELVEPALFLDRDPESAGRLARAIATVVAAAG